MTQRPRMLYSSVRKGESITHRMTGEHKMEVTVHPLLERCPWCKLSYRHHQIDNHEKYCQDNPRRMSRVISGMYYQKIEVRSHPAPDLRVAALQGSDGKTRPILQDDMFDIFERHPTRIERIGAVRRLHYFRMKELPKHWEDDDVDFIDEVDAALTKARKAGANLND